MKIILKDEASLKEFFSYMNAINQDWKNFKDDSIYTVNKGKLYAMQNHSDGSVHHEADMILNKLKFTQEFFNELDTIINGVELFRYIKDNKKFVTKVTNLNGTLIIKGSNGTKFKSIKPDTVEVTDEDLYNQFMKRANNKKKPNKVKLENHVISKEIIDDIISKPFGDRYVINDKFKLYLSKSVLSSMKGADATIKITTLVGFKGLYLVIYNSSKQKYNMRSFYVITA